MEEIVVNNNNNDNNNNNYTGSKTSLERRIRPQKEQALNCPRCNSTNTKFCYYNNYSLTQPRYFCKTCRRYWTEGGTLRNIPVGGGSRKNKRSSSSSNGSSSSSLLSPPSTVHSSRNKLPDLIQNPKVNGGQDLNLGFPLASGFKSFSELINMPNFDEKSNNDSSSALELLTGSRRLNYYMPVGDHNGVYTSGFHLPEFKASSLSFSLDGIGNSGYGSGLQEGTSGRLLFPFEDLKVQVPSITATTTTNDHVEQNRENGDSSGVYWNGVLGGGGSW